MNLIQGNEEQRRKEALLRELATHIGLSQNLVPLTSTEESSVTNEIDSTQRDNQTR